MRHRLTDDEWAYISHHFEEPDRDPTTGGRPRANPRTMLDGIFWILRTGAPWRDLPDAFGPWKTVWRDDGTLRAVRNDIQRRLAELKALDESLCALDGTSVRATKAAAGGGKKRSNDGTG